MVRDRRAQGDDVGVGNHRDLSRRALAGHRLRAPPPLHGRDRRRLPLVGLRPRRHRRHLECHRRRGARSRRRDPHRHRRSRTSWSRTALPPASCWRTATISPPTSSPRASTRGRLSPKLVGEEHLPADFVEDVKRYKFRGSSGKVNLALDGLPEFTCLPGPRPSSARRDLDFAQRRVHGARLRRREVRAVFAPPVHGRRHPEPDRSVGRAAGQARDVVLRPVRSVSPEGRDLGRAARSLRRRRRQHARPSTRPTSRTSSCTARSSPRSISSASGDSPKATSSRAS